MNIRVVTYTNPQYPVQSGLSLSPKEIESMTARGRAASMGSIDDRIYFSHSDEVPVEHKRGMDINRVWEESQLAKKRIMDAHDKRLAEIARTKDVGQPTGKE